MTLRINPTTASIIGSNPALRRNGAGFSVAEAATSGSTAKPAVASAGQLMGMDAILALQGTEDDPLTGRRRRQIRRAHGLLDSLETVKIALLSGDVETDRLLNLKAQLDTEREAIDDPRLESLLDEIETRAMVELAKRRLLVS